MPATYGIGSDSYPCTVIAVERNGRTIRLSHDREYRGIFVPNLEPKPGDVIVATLRRDGSYRQMGNDYGFIRLGKRSSYRDPSF
jgi:hypothetical protein